ncbi:7 transmembrane receptor [Ancylostoma ceylanicum]|uniref:7 transmembrane receptor n=1 Tax=Ancylostoma ceylanicum TaxID=53326 RepID=A0A0D6LH09_9BILA|nr:7 transmembrane receptor [Ancylostoma ceylanicum]
MGALSTPQTCVKTSRRGIEWPATISGTTATRPCPEGTRGTSSWRCNIDGLWSEDGPNTMECQSDWTIQRQDALEETIKDQDASGIPETSTQPSNYFLFPSMALWAGENNVDSVDIPKEALELAGLDRSRVYYASYANIGDEMEPPVELISASEENPQGGERRRRVVSRVVAASVVLEGRSVRLPILPRPIIITFHHHPETLRRMSTPQCSWWDMDDLQFECSVIAGCLLYFFLSALTWMLLEGYQLYQMLVEVFPAARRRLTFFLIGYGVPAIITGAAAYYDPTGFGTRHHCWLRTDNLFILFFVAPAALILLTNTMFLFMTMCIVYRHSKYIPCRHATDNGGDIR